MAGTLTVEELKGNVVELQHRAESLLTPEYQVQQVYHPEKRRIMNLLLTQVEWWDFLNQVKAWAQTSRDPICKLAEARASTDDYTFMQLRKVFEDLQVQMDLFSHLIELEARRQGQELPKEGPSEEPEEPPDEEAAPEEPYPWEVEPLPAFEAKAKKTAKEMPKEAPESDQEAEDDADDEEPDGQLEEEPDE